MVQKAHTIETWKATESIKILARLLDIKEVKFIYSEKATKFFKISTLLLSYVVPVKSKVKILQNFVASSQYMNFNKNKHSNMIKIPQMPGRGN